MTDYPESDGPSSACSGELGGPDLRHLFDDTPTVREIVGQRYLDCGVVAVPYPDPPYRRGPYRFALENGVLTITPVEAA